MTGQQLPASIDTSTRLLPLLLDQLVFLSPRTWWGFLQVQSKSPFVAFDLEVFGREILALVAPLLIFWILQGTFSTNKPTSRDIVSVRSAKFLVAFLSPWTLTLGWDVLQELLLLWKTLRFYRTSRSSVLANATWALEDRIQRNRAYRTRRYDVYLPPDLLPSGDRTIQQQQLQQQQPALLMIPGALVPHEAYAEPAGRLSDIGFLVAVVSMEPLRLAYHHLGADLVSMKRIMRKIQRDEEKRRQTKSGASQLPDPPPTAGGMQWTLMGHSMGSFAAMKLFRDAILGGKRQNAGDIAKADSVTISNRLILWALAPFVDMATDLSTLVNTRILIVQASEDHLSQQLASGKAQLEAYFPSNSGNFTTSTTEIHVLAGATHDGFGSYTIPVKESQQDTLRDVQSNKTVVQTNVPTSLPEQQQEACALTSRFCSQNLSPSHFTK